MILGAGADAAELRDDARRRDREIGKAAERGGDVFADADREIIVGGFAQDAERQHGNRQAALPRRRRLGASARLLRHVRDSTPTRSAAITKRRSDNGARDACRRRRRARRCTPVAGTGFVRTRLLPRWGGSVAFSDGRRET